MRDPELDTGYRSKMEEVLRETLFSTYDREFLVSPEYDSVVDDHVFHRYRLFRDMVLPWVAEIRPLRDSVVLEIGSGTGSCAAAIAPHAARYIGFEPDTNGAAACNGRLKIMEIHNCDIVGSYFYKENFWNHSRTSPDIVLFMASLEHMTFYERINSLRDAWEILPAEGLLVVTDTPNGLSPFDHHSSQMPFYHWLSNEVRGHYGRQSPRPGFANRVVEYLALQNETQRNVCFAREGIGISFIDFEIALGHQIHSCVVADGTEKIISQRVGTTFEDTLVQSLFDHYKIPAHPCFSRRALYFILKKTIYDLPS